ncbi:MAG: UDP-N-acetylglucosamine 1-carboxyvinyltransferase [Alphaproteobacteria bacterium]
MDRIRIKGGVSLKGTIPISGAKNATLPLMAASLLTRSSLILTNVPKLKDIETMQSLLAQHGAKIQATPAQKTLCLTSKDLVNHVAPYDIVRKMRASILVLGPLLARLGHAEVSLPGGCAIGTRPVDVHLSGLEAMGAEIELENGYIKAKAPKGLHGASYTFPVISVTGTENLLMAACLARGTTELINAAREPEVADLAKCLQQMGAKIDGIGTNTLTIEGVSTLGGANYRVMGDRIEAGTYIMAAGITGGELLLANASLADLPTVIPCLEHIGLTFKETPKGIWVKAPDSAALCPVDVVTEPFPGFATDLQAQLMALLTRVKGVSTITETVFENRFMHAPELARMGADISIQGSQATINGGIALHGAPVMATDLRASFSLVLAALAAEGETEIQRIYHLDRGYEEVEKKLIACGAHIERIFSEDIEEELSADPLLEAVG